MIFWGKIMVNMNLYIYQLQYHWLCKHLGSLWPSCQCSTCKCCPPKLYWNNEPSRRNDGCFYRMKWGSGFLLGPQNLMSLIILRADDFLRFQWELMQSALKWLITQMCFSIVASQSCFFLWYVSIDSSNIQWFLIHVFRCQFGPFVGGSLEHQVTKSLKYLSWRYRTFFSGYFGGWTFPCISRIHTAYNRWGFLRFRYLKCLEHQICQPVVFQPFFLWPNGERPPAQGTEVLARTGGKSGYMSVSYLTLNGIILELPIGSIIWIQVCY